MILSLIVAKSRNNVIGIDNKLPWILPKELEYFKKFTLGKTVIMGRNTFESMDSKPLTNRFNIVVTSNELNEDITNLRYAKSIEEGIAIAESLGETEVVFIGGQRIYEEAIKLKLDTLMITTVHLVLDGDTLMPTIPNMREYVEKYNIIEDGFNIKRFDRV